MEHIANQRLGERLRKLRVERKLTLSGVEALTDGYGERINKSYLFRVERGITVPSIPRLRILAKVFRVKLSSLLEVLDSSFEEHEKKASLRTDLGKLGYDQLRKEGIKLERSGDFTQAALFYRAALSLAEKEEDKKKRAEMIGKARYDLSIAFKNLGNLDMAREEAEAALEEPGVPEDILDYVRVGLSNIYRRLNRPVIAAYILEKSFGRIDVMGKVVLVSAYISKGNLLLDSDSRAAARAYRKALPLARRLKDYQQLWATLHNLSYAERNSRNFNRALKALVDARSVAEKQDMRFCVAKCQSEIGQIYFLQREFERSRAELREANVLARAGEHYELLFLNQYYLRKINLELGEIASAKTAEASMKFFATRVESSLDELIDFKSEIEDKSEEGKK